MYLVDALLIFSNPPVIVNHHPLESGSYIYTTSACPIPLLGATLLSSMTDNK